MALFIWDTQQDLVNHLKEKAVKLREQCSKTANANEIKRLQSEAYAYEQSADILQNSKFNY